MAKLKTRKAKFGLGSQTRKAKFGNLKGRGKYWFEVDGHVVMHTSFNTVANARKALSKAKKKNPHYRYWKKLKIVKVTR